MNSTMPSKFPGLPWWSLLLPPLACLPLLLGGDAHWFMLTTALCLIAAVFIAVFHAEVVAHRIGEPLGTLVLALAVTLIEVSLIASIMTSGAEDVATLARDTVFATVMIICNGVVGLCLLAGAIRHRVIAFRVEGTASALSVLTALTALTLVLPEFTTSTAGPTYSPAQMIFAGTMSLLLYAVFLFVQTIRHREFFLPTVDEATEIHAPQPSGMTSLLSLVMLLITLIAVVGLTKQLSPSIQSLVSGAGAPPAVVGIIIAALVLLPETVAALRAALLNRMQISLNLALGSALATIGLTIPCVVAIALWQDLSLILGLPSKELVLLLITLVISTMTLAGGRATVLQGAVHLVLFAAFLFLAIIP